MIEVSINKDIQAFEPKLIGPFTTRQLICVIISAVLAILGYNTLGTFLPQDLRIVVCFVFAAPSILVGWAKPLGMKFEHFAKVIVLTYLLAPNVRKYKTVNALAYKTPAEITEEKKENERRKKAVESFNNKRNLAPEHKAYL